MTALFRDIRHAARTLRLNSRFTLATVTILALALGANAVVFTFFDTVLLRPLPYPDADQLVLVGTNVRAGNADGEAESEENKVSYPNFVDLRAQSDTFAELTGFDLVRFRTNPGAQAEPVWGANVTGGFLQVFGTRPALGRFFSPGEFTEGANQVVILSDRLWKKWFAGRTDVIGRSVSVDGTSHLVVGVLPPDFVFCEDLRTDFRPKGRSIELIRPLAPSTWMLHRGAKWLSVVGRMKPGVSVQRTQQVADVVARRLEYEYPVNRGLRFSVETLQSHLASDTSRLLLSLLAGVGLILLIACANVASLFLVRAAGRDTECAIRAALGARRLQIARQLLAESLLVAFAGGAIGLFLAWLGCGLVDAFRNEYSIRMTEAHIDGRILLFTFSLSTLAGLLTGLVPAFQLSRTVAARLTSRQGGSPAHAGSRRARKLLLTAQVTVSMILLVAATLLAGSLLRLRSQDPGFRPDRVLSLTVPLHELAYPEVERQRAFYRELLARVDKLPGVQSAGLVFGIPLGSERSHPRTFSLDGQASTGTRELSEQELLMVSSRYFSTMGIPTRAGRPFTEQDDQDAQRVAIVNEAMARRYWGNGTPVGRRVVLGNSRLTVVGVVGDVRRGGLEQEASPEIYLPYLQAESCLRLSLVVRTATPADGLAKLVRREIQEIDPDQIVENVQTMEKALSAHLAVRRATVLTALVFALLALGISATGLYGFIAYSVSRRRPEFGIRIALGARTGTIVRLVMREGVQLVLLGIVAGTALAMYLMRFLTTQLYGVRADDLFTFIAVGLFLLSVALAACFLPARRAALQNPASALRAE